MLLCTAKVVQRGFCGERYRDWGLIYPVWKEISQIGARQAGLPQILFIGYGIAVEGFVRQDAGTNFREGHIDWIFGRAPSLTAGEKREVRRENCYQDWTGENGLCRQRQRTLWSQSEESYRVYRHERDLRGPCKKRFVR